MGHTRPKPSSPDSAYAGNPALAPTTQAYIDFTPLHTSAACVNDGATHSHALADGPAAHLNSFADAPAIGYSGPLADGQLYFVPSQSKAYDCHA